MKIGIIGAGIAGIATAIRMASRGYEVTVFEANSYPGGKLSAFHNGPYRFDAGPSLFTMPSYVEELFQVAKTPIQPYFEYEKLPIICHYFWEDGTMLNAFSDTQKFAATAAEKFNIPAEKIIKLLKESQRKYELTGKIFLTKSLHKINTWLDIDVAKAMIQIPTLDIFKSMNCANEQLLKHPKLVQLFNRYATYNGSNPYKAPGLLNIIPHFEFGIGAFFPKGGMNNITQSLFQLAESKGVQFHFSQKVNEIIIKNKKAVGLQVNEQSHFYDQIVSNMDVFFAYHKLMPNEVAPKRILKQKRSTSALIFYWGIEDTFPALGLHNIFFSEDYKTEFEKMEQGTIFEDPTVYVNISQKYNPTDAPANCENWFTMINVPYNNGQNWD